MIYGAVDYVHDDRELTVDLDFEAVELNRLLIDQNIPLGEVATRVDGELLYRFNLSRSEQGSGRGEVRLTEDLALGRDYDLRNTRDSQGAIFPIGDVEPRLSWHDDVFGVVTSDGRSYAFHSGAAIAALRSGQTPQLDDVKLELYAGGLRAVSAKGTVLAGHQSYWFAWSQFHSETLLWPKTGD